MLAAAPPLRVPLQMAVDLEGRDICSFPVASEAEAFEPAFQQGVNEVVADMLREQQRQRAQGGSGCCCSGSGNAAAAAAGPSWASVATAPAAVAESSEWEAGGPAPAAVQEEFPPLPVPTVPAGAPQPFLYCGGLCPKCSNQAAIIACPCPAGGQQWQQQQQPCGKRSGRPRGKKRGGGNGPGVRLLNRGDEVWEGSAAAAAAAADGSAGGGGTAQWWDQEWAQQELELSGLRQHEDDLDLTLLLYVRLRH